jgi:hypothetical protein
MNRWLPVILVLIVSWDTRAQDELGELQVLASRQRERLLAQQAQLQILKDELVQMAGLVASAAQQGTLTLPVN